MNCTIVKLIVGCFIALMPMFLFAQPIGFDGSSSLEEDFSPREILLLAAGDLSNSLEMEEEYTLSTITINFRKEHENGVITLDQKVLHKGNIKAPKATCDLVYSNLSYKDLADRLTYDYQIIWQYKGEAEIKQNWTTTESSIITLNAPTDQGKI